MLEDASYVFAGSLVMLRFCIINTKNCMAIKNVFAATSCACPVCAPTRARKAPDDFCVGVVSNEGPFFSLPKQRSVCTTLGDQEKAIPWLPRLYLGLRNSEAAPTGLTNVVGNV